MKKSGLVKLIASAGIAANLAGCASWPTPVKVVATPIAVVRDVVDLPLASGTTFFNNVAEGSRADLGNTQSGMGYGWQNRGNGWHGGPGIGLSMDLTYPFCKLFSGILAVPDYLLSRSLCGSAAGKSPWLDYENRQTWGEYLFPNMNSLWSD
jgi:hypothetical protein